MNAPRLTPEDFAALRFGRLTDELVSNANAVFAQQDYAAHLKAERRTVHVLATIATVSVSGASILSAHWVGYVLGMAALSLIALCMLHSIEQYRAEMRAVSVRLAELQRRRDAIVQTTPTTADHV